MYRMIDQNTEGHRAQLQQEPLRAWSQSANELSIHRACSAVCCTLLQSPAPDVCFHNTKQTTSRLPGIIHSRRQCIHDGSFRSTISHIRSHLRVPVSPVIGPASNGHSKDGVRLEPRGDIDLFVEARISVYVRYVFRLCTSQVVVFRGSRAQYREGRVSCR